MHGSTCIFAANLTIFSLKNYHGYEKQYHGNLFIRPDIGCGSDFCGENDASGVTAPKPLSEHWYNNTCITAGSPYSGDCSGGPDLLSSDTMQPSGNMFLTPSGDPTKLLVNCAGAAPPAPPAPPGPPHCDKTKTSCTAAWHCATCKVGASVRE